MTTTPRPRSNRDPETDRTTILVPIRYPLTDESARTLGMAGRLAQKHAPSDLRVLHVNLYHSGRETKTVELTRAISSTLAGVETEVTTRRGFLVEEVILKDATQMGADIVVVGTNQQPWFRRLVSRVFGSEPDVSSFLRENTSDSVAVVDVDTTTTTPALDSA